MGVYKLIRVTLQVKCHCPLPSLLNLKKQSQIGFQFSNTLVVNISLYSTLNCTLTIKLNKTMNICAVMVALKRVKIHPMGKLSLPLLLCSLSHGFDVFFLKLKI